VFFVSSNPFDGKKADNQKVDKKTGKIEMNSNWNDNKGTQMIEVLKNNKISNRVEKDRQEMVIRQNILKVRQKKLLSIEWIGSWSFFLTFFDLLKKFELLVFDRYPRPLKTFPPLLYWTLLHYKNDRFRWVLNWDVKNVWRKKVQKDVNWFLKSCFAVIASYVRNFILKEIKLVLTWCLYGT
jgi:hypothetical protein